MDNSSEPADDLPLIRPDWAAPDNIHAFSTTRTGGVSHGPYKSLNLGDHVGDDLTCVSTNRQRLLATLGLPCNRAQWLRQVHGTKIIEANPTGGLQEADGCYTDTPQLACIIMTADCLPVVFCDASGKRVAAVHAGWRGLLNGILENAVRLFPKPEQVQAWMAPAIGPAAFEVGDDVRQPFIDHNTKHEAAFKTHPSHTGKWLADIYQLARTRLETAGVRNICGGSECTAADSGRFFSFRRDGVTGRMATGIWIS